MPHRRPDAAPSVNLKQLLAEATDRLAAASLSYGHGTTNPHDEAAWLVLWSLDLPLDTDTDADPSPLDTAAVQQALALVQRRIDTREPAAYLTGEAWLQGVPFHIDRRSIVPRSFIAELLVDGTIDHWLSDETRQVLDLCTGNGSLAVLAAMAWPEVQVCGADLSPDALAVARLNVDRHGLQDRIALVESDGLTACPGPWDLILCNPPYVNAQSMAALPAEYRAEPELALAGGEDGMDFIRQLLSDAPRCLNPEGVLVLEIGNERANFERAFPDLDAVWLPVSAGDDQVLLLTREALNP